MNMFFCYWRDLPELKLSLCMLVVVQNIKMRIAIIFDILFYIICLLLLLVMVKMLTANVFGT